MFSNPYTNHSSLLRVCVRLWLVLALLAATLGIVSMAATYASDGAGNGLNFDGQNDYVAIAHESNFDFTNQMTVELWIKVDQFDRLWQAIVTKGDDSWRIQRYVSSNNVAFSTNGISDPLSLRGSTDVNDGNWHHVAAVYTGSMKYLYVDGSLDGSQPASGNLPNSVYAVYIGENAQMTGRHFDGQIDEVRVWNVARTQAQVQADMHRTLTGSEGNLVAYWQFDEGSGTTAYDLTSNANDGTLVNMNPSTAWVASTGPVGDAIVGGQQDVAAIWAAKTSATSSGLIVSDDGFLNSVGDDIVFGHDGGTGISTGDLPGGVVWRWSRVWYQDITDVGSDGGTVILAFDFNEDGDVGPPSAGSMYALLGRPGTSGDFAVLATTTTVSDSRVIFNVDTSDLEDGWYYTVGEAVPGLALVKTVNDGTPNPGQRLTFTIAVSNHSRRKATSALISDTLPSGLTFAGPVTLEGTGGEVAQDEADLPILAHNLTITNGASITVTFAVTVNTGLVGGTDITNTASVTSAEFIVPRAGSVPLTVNNVAPVAADDVRSTDEDTAVTVSVLGNDNDLNGDNLSVSAVGTPTYGSVTTNSTTVTYTPINRTADYGAVFTYTASDGSLTDTATVLILVAADNDPPTAAGDAIAVNEDATTANLHATLLSNDTDPDTVDTRDIVSVNTSGTVGTVTLNSGADSLTYTASGFDSLAAGATGTDTFAYTMEDGQGAQSTATVSVIVTGLNDAPTFTSAPVGAAVAGATYTYNITTHDVDAGDLLTITPLAKPGWLTLTDHGDGTATLTGTPSQADIGDYSVLLQVTDGAETATQPFTIRVREKPEYAVYLPLVLRKHVVAPDLVVQDLVATSNNVQIVIRNQGNAPVTDEFWVDVYIDPNPVPTAVNQTWGDLGDWGLVWGITEHALPLQPGDALTLAKGDEYYWAGLSSFPDKLEVGTPVYAQVDSANVATFYGAVLEIHELTGGPYNNISGTTSTASVTGVDSPPAEGASRPAWPGNLPPRP